MLWLWFHLSYENHQMAFEEKFNPNIKYFPKFKLVEKIRLSASLIRSISLNEPILFSFLRFLQERFWKVYHTVQQDLSQYFPPGESPGLQKKVHTDRVFIGRYCLNRNKWNQSISNRSCVLSVTTGYRNFFDM